MSLRACSLLLLSLLSPSFALAAPDDPQTDEQPSISRCFSLLGEGREWIGWQSLESHPESAVTASAAEVLRAGSKRTELVGAALFLGVNGQEQSAANGLRERLTDEALPVGLRGALLEALGVVANFEDQRLLQRTVQEADDGPLLYGAARGLARGRSQAQLSIALEEAADFLEQDTVRYDAIREALESTARSPRAKLLAEAFAWNTETPADLLRVLNHTRGEEAWQAVRGVAEDATHSEDPASRAVGLELLVRSGSDDLKDLVFEGLADGAWEVRVAAAEAVRLVRLRGAYPRLINLLEDPVHEVRIAALRALRELSQRELPALRSQWEQWYQAERARLRAQGADMTAYPPLLSDGSYPSRDSAAEAVASALAAEAEGDLDQEDDSPTWLLFALITALLLFGIWLIPTEMARSPEAVRPVGASGKPAPVRVDAAIARLPKDQTSLPTNLTADLEPQAPREPSAWTCRLRKLQNGAQGPQIQGMD